MTVGCSTEKAAGAAASKLSRVLFAGLSYRDQTLAVLFPIGADSLAVYKERRNCGGRHHQTHFRLDTESPKFRHELKKDNTWERSLVNPKFPPERSLEEAIVASVPLLRAM